jgi:hypothetical protein
MLASFAAAIASAGVGLAAIWDHAGYNVGAALLALLSPLLAYRAWVLSRHRRLEGIQRSQLVLRLRQLPPVELRVTAVVDDEAVGFACQLRDAFSRRVAGERGVSSAALAGRENRSLPGRERYERASRFGPVPVAGARRVRATDGALGQRQAL